jgi:hypothetical protein
MSIKLTRAQFFATIAGIIAAILGIKKAKPYSERDSRVFILTAKPKIGWTFNLDKNQAADRIDFINQADWHPKSYATLYNLKLPDHC